MVNKVMKGCAFVSLAVAVSGAVISAATGNTGAAVAYIGVLAWVIAFMVWFKKEE